MSTTRLALRGHAGKLLPQGWYVSSTSTAAATRNNEILDATRTENDDFWNGAYARITGQIDSRVRGGAGASTGRTPSVLLDQNLASVVAISTNYELLKGWSFAQFDEAIDDALGDSWPYLFDAVDDTSTLLVDQQIEYPLTATWRQVVQVEQEIFNTTPTRYQLLVPGTGYDIDETASALSLRLRFIPSGSLVGLKLRIKARAIPTLGSADASATVHPWQALTPGILANLYRSGPNPAEGALSTRWEKRADAMQALFERRLHRYAITRTPVDTKIPSVRVY